MSSRWRRFEVLLPLRFNDGRDVPGDWIAEAVLEIVDHFGAASYETQKVEGHWRHSGILYRDDLVQVGSKLRAFAPQVGAAPEPAAGGAPLSRVDIGLGEHAPSEPPGNLV